MSSAAGCCLSLELEGCWYFCCRSHLWEERVGLQCHLLISVAWVLPWSF